MKKIKGCLWSAVAICLSAGVPLYGGDDDEKPAPTVRKTLKEIVALFPSKKEEPISDTRPRPCRIEERIPRFDAVATRFNEITQLFKSHIGCSDRILCGAVWERCYFISKQGKDETKEVLASFLFEGCEVGRVRTNVGYKRVRGFNRECHSIRFEFTYEDCDCDCKLMVYKDTKLRLRYIYLLNCTDGAWWKFEELK